MQQSPDLAIIRKYIKGVCTPEEREQVKAFMLADSAAAQALFDAVLDEGWNPDAEQADAEQMAGWKRKFQQKINVQEHAPVKRFEWLKYAAIWAMLIIGAGSYAWWHFGTANTAQVTAMLETTNPNGKLRKITLGDGSTITLNAASTLKYPAAFMGNTREVYLEGEAFFDIAQDMVHPFIVHTARLNVQVLGTSFNIRSYRQDKDMTVAVATGKVSVAANDKGSSTFLLSAGEQLAYNASNETPQVTKTNTADISAWQTGLFVYHNETLENISRQLERWYNVTIVFKKESLRQLRFNIKQKNDKLDNVMQTLQFAGHIQYSISDKVVTIW